MTNGTASPSQIAFDQSVLISGTISKAVDWIITIEGKDIGGDNGTIASAIWDGRDANGNYVPPGTYTATIAATACNEAFTFPVGVVVTRPDYVEPGDNNRNTPPPNACPFGSTANVINGSLKENTSLFSVGGGAASLGFSLSYDSSNGADGSLGLGWMHENYLRLVESTPYVRLRTGGEEKVYRHSGGAYISQYGDSSTLTKNGDSSWTLSFPDGGLQSFDVSGKITSTVDRYGNTTSFAYTGDDLTGVTDTGTGRSVTLGYDTSAIPHRLSWVKDPKGNQYDFEYLSGKLRKVIFPAVDVAGVSTRGYWEFGYDSTGHLTSKRDPNGNVTTYTYNSSYGIESAIDPEGAANPSGHTRSVQYLGGTGNLKTTRLFDKNGTYKDYTFDSTMGRITKIAPSTAPDTAYTYYANGMLKSMTKTLGGTPEAGSKRLTVFYTYDSLGNVTSETVPADLSSYSPAIDPATVTDPDSLASLTPPINKAVSTTYDATGRVTSTTDHRSTPETTTTYTYTTDNGSPVTHITGPGVDTTTRYNANGTISSTTDATGKTVSYEYYPSGPFTGLLKSVTDPSGIKTETSQYDSNGNATETKVYDADGTLRSRTVYGYDALNRLTSDTTYAGTLTPNTKSYGYDLKGNRTSVTDAENHTTRYAFTYSGQTTEITDARSKKTQFVYGSGCSSCGQADKLTEVKDANHVQKNIPGTRYTYDTSGRLETETDPIGNILRYTYYDSGLMKEKFDATNTPETLLVTYSYDDEGRITKRHYGDGTEETFSYYPDGKLHTATNAAVSYTYTYTAEGRIDTVTDSRGYTIRYDEYTALGQRKKVTYFPGTADERTITYDYDTVNRPWKITSAAGTFTYGYDNLGRRNLLSYPNGTEAAYGYDDLGRLTLLIHRVVNGAAFASFTYPQLDQVGNRKEIVKDGVSAQILYDELYRLLKVTLPAVEENFSFDDVGNRLSGPGAKDTAYLHNDANQMLQGRKLAYAYDTRGNQTTKTVPDAFDKTWTQTWNYENRLVKVEKTKGAETRTVTFKYDPLGRRVEKKLVLVKGAVTVTETTTYVYDGDNIVMESFATSSGAEKTFYTHGVGVDEHLALERNGQVYYYHADGLGSVVSIIDSSKAVVQSYTYDSFGAAKPSTGFRNSYTYTGREWDKETGLYYYRARYYNPMEGRFISNDKIGFDGGDINLFNYVRNNPIRYTDRFGLMTDEEKADINHCKKKLLEAKLKCQKICNPIKRIMCQYKAIWDSDRCFAEQNIP